MPPDPSTEPTPIQDRDRRRSRVLLIAIALIGVAAICALFAWAQRRDGRVIGVPAPADRGLVTSIEQLLDEPALEALDGRAVRLDDVVVQAVPGDYVAWVGALPARSVPVLLAGEAARRQPERRVELDPGDRITLWGTVTVTSGAALQLADGALSAAEYRRLARARLLVRAEQIVELDGTERAASTGGGS